MIIKSGQIAAQGAPELKGFKLRYIHRCMYFALMIHEGLMLEMSALFYT